ncbi:MAG TPA: tRNA (adenosine(37)-N6)-dimethylallyltransferase MiaA [Acidimicrobiales bacterium]|nr:tRNA (adenosine(37)-N6)-dimethylallyltransferase MiaA [Acidimicrobiales bacterium]
MGEPTTGAHLAIVGPTATGKSELAMALARALGDVEIVSVDSMQVYRGMDIGTSKPTRAEQSEVAHHLIDLAEPTEDFSVRRYQEAFGPVLAGIEDRGHRAVLVGGTGLYLRAVVDHLGLPGQWPEVRAELEAEADRLGVEALHRRLASLDPVAASRMLASNRRRVVRALEVCLGSGRPFSSFGPGLTEYPPSRFRLFGLTLPRPTVAGRIDARIDAQLAGGLLDEVGRLAELSLSRTARQALGYRELLDHLEGRHSLAEALERFRRRTRAFARRQESWFRRDPRIRWLDGEDNSLACLDALLGDLAA